MLAALEPQLSVLDQRAWRVADLDPPVLELEDDPAGALDLTELEAERRAVLRIACDTLDLLELLASRLRLARARAGTPALDEALEARDLRLLALDRAAERELTRGLLGCARRATCRERSGLRPASSSSTAVPTVSRNQRSCATSAIARGERDQRLLEPLERLEVEVIRRLVEQQQVRARRERAGKRGARQARRRRTSSRPVASPRPRSRGRAPRRWRGCARGSHRGALARPALSRSGRALRGRSRLLPSPPRACAGAASIASSTWQPESRYSLECDGRGRAAGADRGARRASPLAKLSSPPSSVASPASIRSSVVLPAPLRPAIVIRSRRSSLNETPRKSGVARDVLREIRGDADSHRR